MPVSIPEAVSVEVNGLSIKISGAKGTLSKSFAGGINIKHQDNQILVSLNDEENSTKFDKAMHGTARNIIANMLKGVSEGFTISLNLSGIGYKAAVIENGINLNYGYSHLIKFFVREKDRALVKISVPKPDNIIVSSPDKELVGLYASQLKNIRRFNVYKGKGISVTGEKIILKKRKKA